MENPDLFYSIYVYFIVLLYSIIANYNTMNVMILFICQATLNSCNLHVHQTLIVPVHCTPVTRIAHLELGKEPQHDSSKFVLYTFTPGKIIN